jgi:hypothetical protein
MADDPELDAFAAIRATGAYVALGLFVAGATLGGFLLGFGIGAGWGFIGLAVSSLVASYLLGAE